MDRLRGNNVSSITPGSDDVTVTKVLDANRYASKKTIAQGMLDIALLTANASQLKYILQVCVGALFVALGSLNINKPRDHRLADILNDLALIVVFIISILNVIISGFGLEQHPQLLKNLHREDIIEP